MFSLLRVCTFLSLCQPLSDVFSSPSRAICHFRMKRALSNKSLCSRCSWHVIMFFLVMKAEWTSLGLRVTHLCAYDVWLLLVSTFIYSTYSNGEQKVTFCTSWRFNETYRPTDTMRSEQCQYALRKKEMYKSCTGVVPLKKVHLCKECTLVL